MKFVNLRTKRTPQRAKADHRPGPGRESPTKPMAAPHEIHTYTELRQQIHEDLRLQHPEWVLPNGDCPMCDAYEARLVKVLENLKRRGTNDWLVRLHHSLEHGLN
jgi:hypothetical protein